MIFANFENILFEYFKNKSQNKQKYYGEMENRNNNKFKWINNINFEILMEIIWEDEIKKT